jgi:sugar O-acyltransferase (sialic acid O-acetyltransferase NeuD family)
MVGAKVIHKPPDQEMVKVRTRRKDRKLQRETGEVGVIQFVGSGGHWEVLKEIADLSTGDGWIIAVGDNSSRRREALKIDGIFARLFHPSAVISPTVEIGVGSVVMAGAIIQAKVVIGRHCIVNTGAQLDHHTELADYVHIAPGAVLCGGVKVGEGAFIGAGAVIPQNEVIPPWEFIKAGSVWHPTK